MCLAIPGEVLSVDDSGDALRNGRVGFGGVVKEVSLALVPEAGVGDYVLVHAGMAITAIDKQEAMETLEYFRQIGELEAGDGT